MKMIKMALLGGAALAVTTAAARADDLSALKAQIESLNARVAQMEAAPAVPAGYSLLTISEGPSSKVPGLNDIDTKQNLAINKTATIISVLPTADAPAAASVEWTGFARAALAYGKDTTRTEVIDADGPDNILGNADDNALVGVEFDDNLDVKTRGQINVLAKTETAVGEVGVRMSLRANWGDRDTNPAVVSNEYWGWWAMTPELTLGGGWTGSLGNIGYGYDGACSCYYTDNADVAMNPGDAHQMRLSYASGPFSMGIAVEDDTGKGGGDFDALAVAGEIRYSGDMFNGEISGYAGDDRWRAGAGIGFALGDIASISLGAQVGDKDPNVDDAFWTASILGSVNLSDEIHAEAAYGHTEYDDRNYSVDAVLAGIYYSPVSQLTIGLEGEWAADGGYTDFSGDTQDVFFADLVTVFRF